jgi:Fe-S oxidoreductase
MNGQEYPIDQAEMNKVVEAVRAIKDGPRVLQLYMDICAKCGTCAKQCHVSCSEPLRRNNPASRSDHIRGLYKMNHSVLQKLAALLCGSIGASLKKETLDEWFRDFYECSGCRRCAKFCPFGIDNSVITRKGRTILHSLGLTPAKIRATQKTSDQFGNNEGIPLQVFMDNMCFLEDELLEEHGVRIRIPVDERADVLFATASAEILAHAETLMGCATFFHVAGISWTMSSEAFDAANFGFFSGDDAHMKRKNKLLHDACMKLKVKKLVIGECGHAYRVAKHIGGTNYWGKEIPYEITSILILAAEVLRKGGLKLDPSRNPMPVTYHDPCNFARSAGIIEEPREILRACVEDFREMTPNRDLNWCCGGGGGLGPLDSCEGVREGESSFYEYRMQVTGKKKLEQIISTGARYVAAPCGNCKRQITQLVNYHKHDVEVGGLFDLFDKAIIL